MLFKANAVYVTRSAPGIFINQTVFLLQSFLAATIVAAGFFYYSRLVEAWSVWILDTHFELFKFYICSELTFIALSNSLVPVRMETFICYQPCCWVSIHASITVLNLLFRFSVVSKLCTRWNVNKHYWCYC